MKSVLPFAAGSVLVFMLASALAVFLAPQTAGNTFQVLCVLSLVATALLLAGFGVGAAIVRRLPRRPVAAALGAGGAFLFVCVLAVAEALHANPVEWWGLVLLLPVLGAAGSLSQRRPVENQPS